MNGHGNRGRDNPHAAPRLGHSATGRESQRASYVPSQTDLQAEIAKRNSRRQAHATAIVSQKPFTERPKKPKSLSGKDEHGASLTAHHMLPHSRIKQEFGTAVRNQDLTALQNISTFGGKTIDSSEAFRATAFYKTQNVKTKSGIVKPEENLTKRNLNSMYKAASWDQNNIFMGPSPVNRSDDPGNSAVDVRRNDSGQASKASLIAQNVMQNGFSAQNPQDFASQRAASTQEAGQLRPYRPADWVADGTRTSKKGKIIPQKKQR